MTIRSCVAALIACCGNTAMGAEIVVRADKPGPAVSPTLYGAFFEDINRAGDGGIYGEMLQNRSFEDATVPLGWTLRNEGDPAAEMKLAKDAPINPRNPTQLKVTVTKAGAGVVVFNEGFKGTSLQGKAPTDAAVAKWVADSAAAARRSTEGLHIQDGKEYDLSIYLRSDKIGMVQFTLEQANGRDLASGVATGVTDQWKKFDVKIVARGADSNARFTINLDSPGTLWIDMASLFPSDTFKNRPNGMRADLVQMMADMHPGLLRFPGGSFSEGAVLADAWRWKETIGDIAQRGSNWNIWGYRTSNGIGFHEYLQLAEDLHAAPLFVAHVGMAERGFVPVDQLEPWIQDVLDAIEYANGPADSRWGALRARAGHPEPFHLQYVEIGNENGMGYSWGGGTRADYLPRYKVFYERIKAKYPDIVTVANIHTEPDVPAEIVDEHYYEASEWFFRNATLYDTYDRKKPKIYVGEYAAKNDGGNGNLRAALAEAAFLTGLERNADAVTMSSYAPLFTTPAWQRWKPDAIVFNNATAFGTPSYHVQAMFGTNRPDTEVPVELPSELKGLFACAGVTKAGEVIVKVVNSGDAPQTADLRVSGAEVKGGKGWELTGAALGDENSFAEPKKMAPREFAAGPGPHAFPKYSVTVLRFPKQ